MKNCKCVADEVFREKGERKKGKKKKKRKKESWNVLEFGGSGRLQKRKEVKKEKCKGTCVEEKKKREKKKKEMRYVCEG